MREPRGSSISYMASTEADLHGMASSLRSHCASSPTSDGSAVFVVDDERIIAFTLSVILLEHGYKAFWFTDPVSALEAAKSHQPCLLITDYNMPSMSGLDLATSIRELCPRCRILVISAQLGFAPCSELNFVREQGWMFLAKPATIDHVLNCVSSLLVSEKSDQAAPPPKTTLDLT